MIEELKNEIAELRQEINNLKASYTLPKEVEDAMGERLGRVTKYFTGYTQSDVQRSIELTGLGQTIQVLEYPTGFLRFTYNGKVYQIPYFNDVIS